MDLNSLVLKMKFIVKEYKGRSVSLWLQKIRGVLWIHFQGRTFTWTPPSPADPPARKTLQRTEKKGALSSANIQSLQQTEKGALPPLSGSFAQAAPDNNKPFRQTAPREEEKKRFLRAPVTGRIQKAPSQAEEGRAVKKGEILCTLSSMKMEYSLAAPSDGRLGKIKVQEGDAVQKGDPLIEMTGLSLKI